MASTLDGKQVGPEFIETQGAQELRPGQQWLPAGGECQRVQRHTLKAALGPDNGAEVGGGQARLPAPLWNYRGGGPQRHLCDAIPGPAPIPRPAAKPALPVPIRRRRPAHLLIATHPVPLFQRAPLLPVPLAPHRYPHYGPPGLLLLPCLLRRLPLCCPDGCAPPCWPSPALLWWTPSRRAKVAHAGGPLSCPGGSTTSPAALEASDAAADLLSPGTPRTPVRGRSHGRCAVCLSSPHNSTLFSGKVPQPATCHPANPCPSSCSLGHLPPQQASDLGLPPRGPTTSRSRVRYRPPWPGSEIHGLQTRHPRGHGVHPHPYTSLPK